MVITPSNSKYVLIELDDSTDTSDAFPAGFVGYPQRDFSLNGNSSVQPPLIDYKTTYGAFEKKRKFYLGISNTVGIDQDLFDYKGVPNDPNLNMWTGLTKGFHMDVAASATTIDGVEVTINSNGDKYSPKFEFDTGCCEFRTDFGVEGTDYEKIDSRKFTLVPYGGFDGWDVYRDRRTNTDTYSIRGTKGKQGVITGNFEEIALTNGDEGNTSDFYAYLEAIWTFNNPEAQNINVLVTPGIDTFDNTDLVEETIEMVEEDRADSIYIVTTPDVDAGGEVLDPSDVVF